MVKRFIERFQLWRQDRADEFDDKLVAWLLFFAVLIVGRDAYTIVTRHHLTWSAIISTPLILAFVVLYIRRSRCAWVLLMLFAMYFIGTVPFAYMSATPHAPAQIRLLAAAFSFACGIAAFIYSLVIRKRFARYQDTI
jgi:membrane-anchored protein YejM (alkaline phosphatase superfamily)